MAQRGPSFASLLLLGGDPSAPASTHKVSLRADLERDTAGGALGVVDSLGTRLDVLGHLVVVASGEGREVAETVEGDGVLGGREANGTSVPGDGTRGDIVGRLGTDKEAVTADNGVSSEAGTLDVSSI